MSALRVCAAGESDAAEWDAFVAACRKATFFHHYGWRRVVEQAYGHRGIYLMAYAGEKLAGVLPLIDVRSPFLGRRLISTAFTVGGGIAAESDDARFALAEAAIEEGRRRRARYVELRSAAAAICGWPAKTSVYATFEAPLIGGEEEALEATPRKRRAELRKALAAVSAGALKASFEGDADDFYRLYARAMRTHGTPVFPRRFLDALLAEFADHAEILLVSSRKRPILALLTFCFRDRAMPYYFGADRGAREAGAYDLAIWLTMRRAVERGCAVFDFGRSRYGTGSFAYKTHWGFAPRPLEYQYALLGAKTAPNVSPSNPKFALFAEAWRRLPLFVANAAGPLIARHLA
jgi:FemAB-related protein (PEP-CTERM system-associated)